MATLIEAVHHAGKHIDSPKLSRPSAVAAAMEVIAGYASSGNPNVILDTEFANLSKYADQIEAALKTK